MTAVVADITEVHVSEFRLARSADGLLSVIRVSYGPDGGIAAWEPIALSDMDPSDMACDLDLLTRWAPTAWIDVVELDELDELGSAAPASDHRTFRPDPVGSRTHLPMLFDTAGQPVVFLHGNPAIPVRHIARPDGLRNQFGSQAFCGVFGLTDSEMFTRAAKTRPLEQVIRIMSQYRTREVCGRCDTGWVKD